MIHRIMLVLALVGAIGCKSRWTGRVEQPALVLDAHNQTARTSLPITILLRDMELRRTRLANTAYYVVVSRDRFRFHLTLQHKWEAMSDVRTWEAWVEDGAGARHEPQNVDQRRLAPLRYGRIPIYRGVIDFTIYARDLFSAGDRITLVLRRPGYEYRYIWKSHSEPET